jgi:hypothetical protein
MCSLAILTPIAAKLRSSLELWSATSSISMDEIAEGYLGTVCNSMQSPCSLRDDLRQSRCTYSYQMAIATPSPQHVPPPQASAWRRWHRWLGRPLPYLLGRDIFIISYSRKDATYVSRLDTFSSTVAFAKMSLAIDHSIVRVQIEGRLSAGVDSVLVILRGVWD